MNCTVLFSSVLLLYCCAQGMQQFGYCAVKQTQSNPYISERAFRSSTCRSTLRSSWPELYLKSETVLSRWPLAGFTHDHYCASALRVHIESPAFTISLPPFTTSAPSTTARSTSTSPVFAPRSTAVGETTRPTPTPTAEASDSAAPSWSPVASPLSQHVETHAAAHSSTAGSWLGHWASDVRWPLTERDTYALLLFVATVIGWAALILFLISSARSSPPSGTPLDSFNCLYCLIAARNVLIYGQFAAQLIALLLLMRANKT